MKIDSSIQHILNQKGKVMIPGFGTFTTAQASATVTDAGGVIAPPQADIQFTEEVDPSAHSLADYLVASGQVSESDVDLEIEAFIKGVQNTVDSSGKAGLGALGYFQKGALGLEFVTTGGTQVGADSFGLPKLTARPLVPVPVSDNSPATTGSGDNLLLKAILIPLVIIAVALAYFLINPETYEAMKSYFAEPSTEANIPPPVRRDQDKPKDNTSTKDEKDTDNADPVKGTDKTDDTKAKATEDTDKGKETDEPKTTTDNTKPADQPKPKETTTTTDKDTNSSSDVVTTKTSRFYIIIGSFTNDKAAQKKIAECKKLGYSGAKILKMNGKIRVSIQDHDQRNTAINDAKKLGKDFPGAWVLAN